MNIGLIGYGKMGKSIEQEALIRGHNIAIKLSNTPKLENLKKIDVAIEFSNPDVAFNNIKFCLQNNIPVVSGTTGWLDKIDIIKNICLNLNGTFIYSSNYSIGVNILFIINLKLAKLMSKYIDYNINIKELHHLEKKDIPSGTSISLAKDIIKFTNKNDWTLNKKNNDNNKLLINAKRLNNEIGTHIITYKSLIDKIEIKHKAYNRRGFAIGALIAAEWILKKNKKGCFSMKDVLNI